MDGGPFYDEMMRGMFIDTANDNPIELADFEAVIGRVHTLKGVSGNLEMTLFFTGYVQVLDLLRMNQPKEALKEYERLLPIQEAFTGCIRRHMSNE